MKNINKIFIALLSFVLVLSSCSDMFEIDPNNKILEKDHYQTVTDLQNASIGIFDKTREVAERLVIVSGLKGDLLTTSSVGAEEFVQIDRFSTTTTNKWVNPDVFFNLIVNCNDLIAKAEQYRSEDPETMSQEEYEAHVVTAHVTRIWTYLNLAKLYGSVPYFTDPLRTLEDAKTPGVYTVLSFEQLVDKLLEELDYVNTNFTYTSLDWTGVLGLSDYSWNRMMMKIQPIETEVYLWKAAFSKDPYYSDLAFEVANTLVTQAGQTNTDINKVSTYFATTKWRNIIRDGATSSNHNELIVGSRYNKINNQRNELQTLFSNGGTNLFQIAPTTVSVNMFENQTNKSTTYAGDAHRGEGVSYIESSSVYVVNKYSMNKQDFDHDADIFVYRAGEIWLMLAEALNQVGERDKAMVLINNGLNSLYANEAFKAPFNDSIYMFDLVNKSNIGVRGRAGVKPVELSAIDMNDDGMIDATDSTLMVQDYIVQETGLELAYEAKRWFTIMRMAIYNNDPSYLANKIGDSFPDGSGEDVRSKLTDMNEWFLPTNW